MAANAKTKRFLLSETYRKIRASLLKQLEKNGTTSDDYIDLIDDYMDMWVTKSLLVEDIQRRGPTVKYDNGGGQKGEKKNDSVELRIKVNAQMLKLRMEIGLKPTGQEGDDVVDM